MREKLLGLEKYLKARIKGQPDAISVLTQAIIRAQLGLTKKNRPKGSFLFLGSTGVGKTELALGVADYIFEDSESLVRFDMAEFDTQESGALLLGENRSEQGRLGDAIDRLNEKGGGVLLFDEIEKAHKSLSAKFLSMMDAARVTMSNGAVKDLSNLYLIFTSNLGGAAGVQMTYSNAISIEKQFLSAAQEHFSPELYARFSEKIVFKRLSYEDQLEICESMLNAEVAHIEAQLGIKIQVSKEVFNYLVEQGFSKYHGARPMRSVIEKFLGNAVAAEILSGKVRQGEEIEVRVQENELIWASIKISKKAALA